MIAAIAILFYSSVSCAYLGYERGGRAWLWALAGLAAGPLAIFVCIPFAGKVNGKRERVPSKWGAMACSVVLLVLVEFILSTYGIRAFAKGIL